MWVLDERQLPWVAELASVRWPVLVVAAAGSTLLLFWFTVLAPLRAEIADLEPRILAARQQRSAQRSEWRKLPALRREVRDLRTRSMGNLSAGAADFSWTALVVDADALAAATGLQLLQLRGQSRPEGMSVSLSANGSFDELQRFLVLLSDSGAAVRVDEILLRHDADAASTEIELALLAPLDLDAEPESRAETWRSCPCDAGGERDPFSAQPVAALDGGLQDPVRGLRLRGIADGPSGARAIIEAPPYAYVVGVGDALAPAGVLVDEIEPNGVRLRSTRRPGEVSFLSIDGAGSRPALGSMP